jgi:integrase
MAGRDLEAGRAAIRQTVIAVHHVATLGTPKTAKGRRAVALDNDLRHGWATMALLAGVHPKVVQERLGHANIGITLDLYSDVTGSLHDEAAETVAALFRDAR